jgi:hypothetical protein
VFVGFVPTFFLRGVLAPVPPSATLTPLLIVHGLANTLWIVLFFGQVSLVASQWVALHRRLGVFGALSWSVYCLGNSRTCHEVRIAVFISPRTASRSRLRRRQPT